MDGKCIPQLFLILYIKHKKATKKNRFKTLRQQLIINYEYMNIKFFSISSYAFMQFTRALIFWDNFNGHIIHVHRRKSNLDIALNIGMEA